jgi:hypothetical protein
VDDLEFNLNPKTITKLIEIGVLKIGKLSKEIIVNHTEFNRIVEIGIESYKSRIDRNIGDNNG